MTDLAAFFGVAALIIVTPGQDTALTIQNTLLGGRPAGLFTALGVGLGQATWTVATAIGLGAVLLAWQPAFLAIRLAGAGYLVFLGTRAMWQATRARQAAAPSPTTAAPRFGRTGALRQGLLSNLGNPKMLVFFISLLPQFAASFGGLVAHGLLFCGMTLVWLGAYAAAIDRVGGLLGRFRVRRAVEGLTGIVLVALGLRLAAEAR